MYCLSYYHDLLTLLTLIAAGQQVRGVVLREAGGQEAVVLLGEDRTNYLKKLILIVSLRSSNDGEFF